MALPAQNYAEMSDADLAMRALRRDGAAVRLITTRNNQRLYRAAWSILKNRAEAEEAVQEAYLKAFTGRAAYSGGSALSTWLTRIVINEALERERAAARLKRGFDVALIDEYRDRFMGASAPSPEEAVVRAQVAKILEHAIARLPDDLRAVFVLRDIEEMSVDDTAEALGVQAETVRTRLFRARRRLRKELGPDLRSTLDATFQFAGANCARMTERVVHALALQGKQENDRDCQCRDTSRFDLGRGQNADHRWTWRFRRRLRWRSCPHRSKCPADRPRRGNS